MSTCARYTQRVLPDNLLIRKLQDAANAYAQYAKAAVFEARSVHVVRPSELIMAATTTEHE